MNQFLKTMAAISMVLACSSSAYCACHEAGVPQTTFHFVNNTGTSIDLMVLPSDQKVGMMDRTIGATMLTQDKRNMLEGIPGDKSVKPGKTQKATIQHCTYTGKLIPPTKAELEEKEKKGPLTKGDKAPKLEGKKVTIVNVTGLLGRGRNPTCPNIDLTGQPKTVTFGKAGKQYTCTVTDGAPPAAAR